MNDLNPWENQLRSWMPRRPSVRLKQVLFPDQSAADVPLEIRPVWHWLAPAACASLLMLFVWIGRTGAVGQFAAASSSNMIASLALSRQNSTPYFAPRQIRDRNSSAEVLDWAKATRFLSNTGSFQLWTNLHKL